MRSTFLALSLLTTAGCTHEFTYTKLNDPPHALTPRRMEDVEVFRGQPPGREDVEIGFIETLKPRVNRDAEISPTIVDHFRKKAGELGCEFIVLESKQPVNAPPARADRFRAACIVYK